MCGVSFTDAGKREEESCIVLHSFLTEQFSIIFFFLLLLLLSDSWTVELSLSLVEEGSTFKRAIILYCLKVRLLFYTHGFILDPEPLCDLAVHGPLEVSSSSSKPKYALIGCKFHFEFLGTHEKCWLGLGKANRFGYDDNSSTIPQSRGVWWKYSSGMVFAPGPKILAYLKGFCFAQVTLCLGSDRVRFSQKVLFWLEINKRWFEAGSDCANLVHKLFINICKILLASEKILKELAVFRANYIV